MQTACTVPEVHNMNTILESPVRYRVLMAVIQVLQESEDDALDIRQIWEKLPDYLDFDTISVRPSQILALLQACAADPDTAGPDGDLVSGLFEDFGEDTYGLAADDDVYEAIFKMADDEISDIPFPDDDTEDEFDSNEDGAANDDLNTDGLDDPHVYGDDPYDEADRQEGEMEQEAALLLHSGDTPVQDLHEPGEAEPDSVFKKQGLPENIHRS